MSSANLSVPSSDVKMLRETLCTAQSLVKSKSDVAYLQLLINACDVHRPLGPNGKHGNRHTETCGCEL